MWFNIALSSCLSGLVSVLFIKLSAIAFEPESRVPLWVKAIGVFWLLLSILSLIISLFFIIWQ